MTTDKTRGEFPAAVIFDLDGTLIDSGRDIADAANAARIRFGLAPLPVATAVSYVGDGARLLVQRMLAHGEPDPFVPPAKLAAGLAEFHDHYGPHCLDHTRCYPGVEAMLDRCGGRPLMVATNKPRRYALAILSALGLDARFERIVAGDDVSGRKPDPAHLAACLVDLEVAAGEVAVVGDGLADIRAARAFGALSVAATWGLTPAVILIAAGPDRLADSPAVVPVVLGLG